MFASFIRFFIVCLSISFLSYAQEGKVIRWNFHEGQKFSMNNKLKMRFEAKVPEQALAGAQLIHEPQEGSSPAEGYQDLVAELNGECITGMVVKRINGDGSAVVESTLSGVKFTATGRQGEQQFHFDSAFFLGEGGAAGEPFIVTSTFVVAPNGALLSIDGVLTVERAKNFRAEMMQSGIEITQDQIEQLLAMFANLFIRYPDTQIKKGSKWSYAVDFSPLALKGDEQFQIQNFVFRLNEAYEVVKEDAATMVIEAISDDLPQLEISALVQEGSVDFFLEGIDKAAYLINKHEGSITSIKRNMNWSGKVTIVDQVSNKTDTIPFSLSLEFAQNNE